LAQSLFNAKWLNYLNLGYTFIVLFAYIIITTSEIGIYDEWKTKLHYKALHYISNPDEIYNSASTAIIFYFVFRFSFCRLLQGTGFIDGLFLLK